MESYKEVRELILKAYSEHSNYVKDCSNIAKLAQEYIDWDENIGCEYFPADGICLTAVAPLEYYSRHELSECVCPAPLFFEYIHEHGLSKIKYRDFRSLCV